MNKTSLILIVLVILAVIVGAFVVFGNNEAAPATGTEVPDLTSGDNPEPGSIHDLPAEPAAVKAREDLAATLGIEVNDIVIMSVKTAVWNDSCLGLGGPAESCLQALVEGFDVELLAQNQTYYYRTDVTGAVLRSETVQ